MLSIELYPIWGITRFGERYSRFDHCVIAWGGGVAQVIVGVPLVAWLEIFGYTRFQAVNAILAILGFSSLSMAVLNLLPVRPLDGAIAWGLPPALSSVHMRARLNANPAGGRGDESFSIERTHV